MYEAFAADLLRSTRAETKPFGKLLRDERAKHSDAGDQIS
jgi:hypothetical protein